MSISTSASLFPPCKHINQHHFSRLHIYAFIQDTWFSLSASHHSVQQTLGSSTSQQMTQSHSFLWLSNIPLYLNHIFFFLNHILTTIIFSQDCGLSPCDVSALLRAIYKSSFLREHYIEQLISQSISSVTQSCLTLCNPMNARLPCPSPNPRVHPNPCPLSLILFSKIKNTSTLWNEMLVSIQKRNISHYNPTVKTQQLE